MSFSSLGLSADLLQTVTQQGYKTPTPVQSQSIPVVLGGGDLIVSAQTGTGKTAAFTLPLLQRLAETGRQGPRRVRALVLTPTRELAGQVSASVRTYGRHLPLRSTEIYGGAPMGPQMKALKAGTDVVVATPGRLMDHMSRGTIDLAHVEVVVLDEADRMLDMGFLPAIERILQAVPPGRQTLLFSATFAPPIRKLAQRFLNEPEVIKVASDHGAADTIEQTAYLVDKDRKRALLSHLIGAEDWQQVLIFTRTKRGADRLAQQLADDGIRVTAIHGDKSQGARQRALSAFKGRSVRALVATDVAARGLDIARLPHVVNFELPDNAEDYVHRVGRTGRCGDSGRAVSLVDAGERRQLAAIARDLKQDIPAHTLAGFEPARAGAADDRQRVGRGRPPQQQVPVRSKRSRPRRGAGTGL